MMTPAAYKAMHYHPETFGGIFALRRMRFEDLAIFRICTRQTPPPAQTELERFTVVRCDGSVVDTLVSEAERSVYRAIFAQSRDQIGRNHRAVVQNTRDGNMQDVDSFVSMGFSFAMHRCDHRLVLKGFYPYFSAVDRGQCMLFFTHAELHRLVLITVSVVERVHALNFILTHGVLHTFDKMCAHCGKTGGLLKCACRAVRYCSRECQDKHWASHKAECREARRLMPFAL